MLTYCRRCVSKNWSKDDTTGRRWCSARKWWFQNSRMFFNNTVSAPLNHWNRNETMNKILCPWRTVFLVKLTGPKLVKNFPAFYGTRRFITVVTRARTMSLSWTRSVQSMPPSNFLKINSNTILSFTPRSSNWFVSLRFPLKNTVCTILLPHTYYMPRPPHSPWFDDLNNIWWAQITKLLFTQSSSLSCLLSRPSYAKIYSSATYSRTSSTYVPLAVWQTKFHSHKKKNQTKITQEHTIHSRYACHLSGAITESTRLGYNFMLISCKFFVMTFSTNKIYKYSSVFNLQADKDVALWRFKIN